MDIGRLSLDTFVRNGVSLSAGFSTKALLVGLSVMIAVAAALAVVDRRKHPPTA
jgi:hypothetical protein